MGIAEVAVGPVHAGIIEPGHFRFSVVGDTVLHLELRHFYTHKGTEKLFEGTLVNQRNDDRGIGFRRQLLCSCGCLLPGRRECMSESTFRREPLPFA